MNISPTGVDITKRFFFALDYLKETKEIRGSKTFTNLYDIDRRNFLFVKKNPNTSVLKPEWIHYLAKEYNISLEWLFFGIGEIKN